MEPARGLLNDLDEKMVVNYLDQALETLHIVNEGETQATDRSVAGPRSHHQIATD